MLEKAKHMKNSLTSRYSKREDIKYYTDVNLETKLWEIIEIPTRRVVQDFTFEDDATKVCHLMNRNKPFGDNPIPAFLTIRG